MKSELLRDHKKEKGQAMVEFALTITLFLFLVLGIIEFGRMLFYINAITSAAREGARYGSAAGGIGGTIDNYADCDGIENATISIGQYAGVRDWGVVISYEDQYGNSKGDCPPNPSINLRDRVVVTVTGKFVPFAGLVNLPEFDYSSTARRTIATDVEVK